MKISYSFKLETQAPAPAKPPEKLIEYSYNEFLLDLPDDWHQVPMSADNALSWTSEKASASITISVDYYKVPDEKAMKVAQFCLDARHEAMENLVPGQVTVLRESVKPYSKGGAIEIVYAAQMPENTYLFLGYVTPRKIFSFALSSGADKATAAELYNHIVSQWLRIKLP